MILPGRDATLSDLRPASVDVDAMVPLASTVLWVLIPAFNEGAVIADVVRDVRRHYDRVLVVDDGSSDNTFHEASDAGAIVLRHITNLGQGAALQTAIDYALRQGAEYICTFDADGQHRAEFIGKMLTTLLKSNVDIVLGSRFMGRAVNIPFAKRIILKSAVLFTRLHARIRVTDTHNGLRLMTRRAASLLKITQPGMAHASEMLSQIARSDLAYVEVPVDVYYTEYSRRKGQSVTNAVKIALELLYSALFG